MQELNCNGGWTRLNTAQLHDPKANEAITTVEGPFSAPLDWSITHRSKHIYSTGYVTCQEAARQEGSGHTTWHEAVTKAIRTPAS